MSVANLIKLTRPINCVLGSILFFIGCFRVVGYFRPDFFVGMFITILIAGAGNTINDYFDFEIDKKIKPHRVLPSGRVSLKTAFVFYVFLVFLSMIISFYYGILGVLMATIVNGLLFIYSGYMKDIKFIGNIVVSFVVSSGFLYAGILYNNLGIVIYPTLALLILNLSREIIKDLEDFKAKEKYTIPKILGIRNSKILILFLLGLGYLFSFKSIIYFVWWRVPLIILSLYFTGASVINLFKKNYTSSQKYIKKVVLPFIFSFII